MTAENDLSEWVLRVLGVTVDRASAGPAAPAPEALLPLWLEAKEAADTGIEQLQRALREIDDPDFRQIAEYGLNGATTGQSTKLMVALREMSGEASPQTRAKLESAIQSFRDFLSGSPIVRLLEDNPFGVAVPIRRTLGSALDEIERSIAA